jgi:hypothetical protein
MEMHTKTRNSMLPIKISASILTALFLFFGTASFAQERENVSNTAMDDFNEWDANADQQWDRDEFNNRINDAGMYNDWDTDNDGLFSNEEANQGIFNSWDGDEDGFLSSEEYNAGNAAWEEDFGNNFDTWDANDDDMLDMNEYNTGFSESGVFNDWDTDNDGMYSSDEFNEGLYNTWDTNDDGFLNSDEYGENGYNSLGID